MEKIMSDPPEQNNPGLRETAREMKVTRARQALMSALLDQLSTKSFEDISTKKRIIGTNEHLLFSDSITYGSGLLTYLNLLQETISVNSASWAIKKTITLNSGHQVPMIQIFFADNSSNVDDDGRVIYFILQLEGSSVTSKSETYYLNNDKIYKARVKLNADSGKIEEICYIQEPDPTKGKVNIYTSNIRIGEELRVDGYANMLDMEVLECKTMN